MLIYGTINNFQIMKKEDHNVNLIKEIKLNYQSNVVWLISLVKILKQKDKLNKNIDFNHS
jgi:hypothetical protein